MKLFPQIERWVHAQRELFSLSSHRYVRELAQAGAATDQPKDSAMPHVVFDLATLHIDGPQGRRFYQLANLFRQAGFPIVIRNRFRFLASAQRRLYKRRAIEGRAKIIPVRQVLDVPHWLITDHRAARIDRACEKILRLTAREPLDQNLAQFPVPFGLHPNVHEAGGEQGCVFLRKQKRLRRLFFAGSTRHAAYQRISRKYALLPRHVIVDTLARELSPDQIRRLDAEEDLRDACQPFACELTVAESHVQVIPYDDWLSTLACADFFLACPGQYMPMCHNMIESLAVGTIPVTEYADYMHPRLEDGVNCVTFRGEADLVRKVKSVLAMSADEIQRLRCGAIDYFERHLRTTSVIEKLQDSRQRSLNLHVAAHEWPEKPPTPSNANAHTTRQSVCHADQRDEQQQPHLELYLVGDRATTIGRSLRAG